MNASSSNINSNMRGHYHNPSATSQNQGNQISERSSIRQSVLFRQYESGNDVKNILGSSNLCWDTKKKSETLQGNSNYDDISNTISRSRISPRSSLQRGGATSLGTAPSSSSSRHVEQQQQQQQQPQQRQQQKPQQRQQPQPQPQQQPHRQKQQQQQQQQQPQQQQQQQQQPQQQQQQRKAEAGSSSGIAINVGGVIFKGIDASKNVKTAMTAQQRWELRKAFDSEQNPVVNEHRNNHYQPRTRTPEREEPSFDVDKYLNSPEGRKALEDKVNSMRRQMQMEREEEGEEEDEEEDEEQKEEKQRQTWIMQKQRHVGRGEPSQTQRLEPGQTQTQNQTQRQGGRVAEEPRRVQIDKPTERPPRPTAASAPLDVSAYLHSDEGRAKLEEARRWKMQLEGHASAMTRREQATEMEVEIGSGRGRRGGRDQGQGRWEQSAEPLHSHYHTQQGQKQQSNYRRNTNNDTDNNDSSGSSFNVGAYLQSPEGMRALEEQEDRVRQRMERGGEMNNGHGNGYGGNNSSSSNSNSNGINRNNRALDKDRDRSTRPW